MKNKIFLLPIIALFITSACSDDFLNQPPTAALTQGSFPVSSNDALLATNATYNMLRTWHINTGGFPLLDMMADDATKGSNPSDGTDIRVYDKFEHTATEGSVERWYKTLYQAIRRANLVISEVPNIDMDPALADRLIAEARFLRAYFYGLLVRGFGPVPKVLVVDPPLDLGRAPVEELLAEVIYPDLEYAISILPEKSQYAAEDLGRATKGAARGLLANLKLFYGDYPAVETLTNDIIGSLEYELAPDFDQVFLSSNEHGAESVFEIGAKPDWFDFGGNQYGNTQGARGNPDKGWGFCRPAYTLLEELTDNNDPRLEPSILFLQEEIDGVLIAGEGATPDTTYLNGEVVEIECYNQKVWYPGTDARSSFGYNRRIIRFADVLLMHAEALNENGRTAEALPFLNRVRQRARGNNTPDVLPDITTTNKEEVRTAILNERKFELALEGHRFWDLVRTGNAEAVLGPLGFQAGKNELFPIPQSEVDISQGRITQNPGYN
jgi:starch-binding outer membrane protein, SusD/RagB family